MRMDSMDFLIYRALPYIKNKELEEYESIGYENLRLSDREKKKILRRIRKAGDYVNRKREYHPVLEGMKRVAVIVMAVLSLCFAGTMSIEAVRASIWETIVEWFEESILFRYVEKENVLVPDSLLEYKEPVMDGYERNVLMNNSWMLHIQYKNAQHIVDYRQSTMAQYHIWISNHNTNITSISHSGFNGKVAVYESDYGTVTAIIWYDDTCAYKLSSIMDQDALIELAQSIK